MNRIGVYQDGTDSLVRDRKTRTTIAAKDGVRADDLLNRDFRTSAPDRAWVTDFTYVSTWSGFAYVAFTIDHPRPRSDRISTSSPHVSMSRRVPFE